MRLHTFDLCIIALTATLCYVMLQEDKRAKVYAKKQDKYFDDEHVVEVKEVEE